MNATQDEQWLPIPGYEGAYEASSHGRIRSLDRLDRNNHRRKGCVLRPYLHKGKGYNTVGLWTAGQCRCWDIHRLVALAFHGPYPDWAEQVRHLDGNKLNNRADNLEYGTRSENTLDSVDHGQHGHRRKTHCAQGHEFTPENMYIYQRRAASGNMCTVRVCKTCTKANSRKQDAKRVVRKRLARAMRQDTE